MVAQPIHILLVDDDEDDYVITRDLLMEIDGGAIDLDWVTTFDLAVERLNQQDRPDLLLIDYRIGERTGIDLVAHAQALGFRAPMILLTGQGTRDIDLAAMTAGADDYLIKSQMTLGMLDRSMRYALERFRMYQSLRESEARFRAAAEGSLDAFLLLRAVHDETDEIVDFKIVDANARAEQMFSSSRHDLSSLGLFASDPVNLTPDIHARFADVMQTGTAYDGERTLVLSTGETIWVQFQVVPLTNGVAITLRDITDRKRDEQRIRDQAVRLNALSEATATFAAESLEPERVFDTIARRLGEVLGDTCLMRLLSDDREWLRLAAIHHPHTGALEEVMRLEHEAPVRATDGVVGQVVSSGESVLLQVVDVAAIPTQADDLLLRYLCHVPIHSLLVVPMRVRGSVIGTLAVSRIEVGHPYTIEDQTFLQDLADRAAQAVDNARLFRLTREAETRYRTLVENIPAITFTVPVRDSGRPMYMSPQIETLTGYAVEEWQSATAFWISLVHPEDRERMIAENERSDKSLEPLQVEYRMIAKDGEIVWVRNEAVIVRNEAGEPLYWQGFLLDISDAKRAEEAVRFQAQLLGAVGQAVIATDIDGAIIYWNRAAEELYGWRSAEVLGQPVAIVTPSTMTRDQAETIMDQLRRGESWSGEFMVRHRDGTSFQYSSRTLPYSTWQATPPA